MPAGKQVEFLGIGAAPGSRVRARVPVSEMADGTPVQLPITIINGREDGPTVYIQACLHGNEVTGWEIARQITGRVQPDTLAGTVVVCHAANPLSFLTRTRGFAYEERGPNDINRVFPGNSDGLLTERVAHTVLHGLALRADFCLDLHCALVSANIAPFTYVSPADNENGTLARREEINHAFRGPLVYYRRRTEAFKKANLGHNFTSQCDAHGVPAVTAEMGEADRVTWEYVPVGVNGVMNVLRHFGLVPGDPEPMGRSERFQQITVGRNDRGGLLRQLVRLGQRVEASEPVAEVLDPFGVVERVTAPAAGIILRQLTITAVYPGAEVVWIAH